MDKSPRAARFRTVQKEILALVAAIALVTLLVDCDTVRRVGEDISALGFSLLHASDTAVGGH